jgi:hypothetical protein
MQEKLRRAPSLFFITLAACGALAAGCSESVEKLEPVPLEALPEGALKEASKALPDVKFERARKSKFEGKDAFEIIGKDSRGKTREVEVSTEGKILEIE